MKTVSNWLKATQTKPLAIVSGGAGFVIHIVVDKLAKHSLFPIALILAIIADRQLEKLAKFVYGRHSFLKVSGADRWCLARRRGGGCTCAQHLGAV